jgi:ComF family protein
MCAVLQALSLLGRETARIVLHAPCVVCGNDLPWRDRKASCCGDCWSALPRITGAKCLSCAMPWSASESTTFRCISCLDDPLPVEWTEAWGHYRGSLERLLHAFKFERHDFLDAPLAELIADTLRDREFDAIIAVPRHPSKVRARGYNQAELLARALAKRTGIANESRLLTKSVERRAHSKLARSERAANVRGAFIASPRLEGKRVLLIDDICTTGETLRACAAAVQKAGAARIAAAVVAKA